MDLRIKDGVVLYYVKFVVDDEKIWVYDQFHNYCLLGVLKSQYCLKEVESGLFELKEVK